MVEIFAVEPGSIAAELGLTKGDQIITINGQTICDYIDFEYETADDFFIIEIRKINGEYWEFEVERELDESLGIIFDKIIFDKLKLCHNNCLFCFVKQQAAGMRKTLRIRDDDYRFSFLQGSFITLTNLSKEEFERIISQRLSPLNISIHTTNPELRKKMMRNPEAGKIMEQLNKLARGGVRFNAQIVLCPGLNDNKELDRTIQDLITLYPNIISLGIVPVGLTRFRKGLYPLKCFNKFGARKVLKQIKKWQDEIRALFGKNWIYASDEFYFLAEEDLPTYAEYNKFPQLENGIGLTRLLWENFRKLEPLLPKVIEKKTIGLVTGKSGEKVLKPIKKRFNLIKGLKVDLIPVENHFFGKNVTVTGLLVGRDIINALNKEKKLPDKLILPGIALNEEGYFLDDYFYQDIVQKFPQIDFFLCSRIEEVMEVIINGKIDCSNCRKAKCR